jgi:hypothetical protein
LSAAAKILSMYCFSDRYKRRVGSYKKRKNLFLFLDLLGTAAEVLTMCCLEMFTSPWH